MKRLRLPHRIEVAVQRVRRAWISARVTIDNINGAAAAAPTLTVPMVTRSSVNVLTAGPGMTSTPPAVRRARPAGNASSTCMEVRRILPMVTYLIIISSRFLNNLTVGRLGKNYFQRYRTRLLLQ